MNATHEQWLKDIARHEEWLKEQARRCASCEKDSTTLMRFKRGAITILGIGYCDDCAIGIRERCGSTRAKVEKHEFAERPQTQEDIEHYLGVLRERYPGRPEPYNSTVSEVA